MSSDDLISAGTSPNLYGRHAANEANAKAQEAKSAVEFLTQDVARLFAVTQALWQILRDERGYSDATLAAKVRAVEAERVQKAKTGVEPEPCPKCARPLSRRHPRCLYCGAEHAFDVFDR